MPSVPQAEALEQHAAALSTLGNAVETAVQVEVLQRSQLAVDKRFVRDVADRTALDVHLELSARRCGETCAEAQQRRLARSVRACHEHEVVGADVERDVAQDALVAVALLQRACVNHDAASAS